MRWIICRAGQDVAMPDVTLREKETETGNSKVSERSGGEKRESRRHAEHPS